MTEEQRANYKEVTRTFDFAAEHNKAVNQSFVIDKNAKFISGLQLLGSNKSAIVFRGNFGLSVDGDTLIQNNTPAELYVNSVAVAGKDRYADLGDVMPSNGKIDVVYTDADNAAVAWGSGYTVKVVLKILLPR
jgi:hypothetical protein